MNYINGRIIFNDDEPGKMFIAPQNAESSPDQVPYNEQFKDMPVKFTPHEEEQVRHGNFAILASRNCPDHVHIVADLNTCIEMMFVGIKTLGDLVKHNKAPF